MGELFMFNTLNESPSGRDKKNMKPKQVKPKQVATRISTPPPTTEPASSSKPINTEVADEKIKKLNRAGDVYSRKEADATQKAVDNIKAGKQNPHDHALTGNLEGTRSLHGDKSKEGQAFNPTNRTNTVIQYDTDKDGSTNIINVGSHKEVYGDPKTNKRGQAGQNAAAQGSAGFRNKKVNSPKDDTENSSLKYPQLQKACLIEDFDEFLEKKYGKQDENLNETKQQKRNFLLEKLYINENKQ